MTLPLSGVRVIDFGRFIAGPYCGMLLADMGADVIRVDRRQGSEDRYTGPVTEGGEGGAFLSLNRNKRSLTLDTAKPESAEIIRRLVAGADVVIANLPVAVMKKMRIDYDSLRAVKADVILARVSAFGPDGPYADRLGFDAVAQAMTGAMSLSGFPDVPMRSAVSFEDYGTALHTAFGVMVALYHRTRTGEGQIVDGSLLATGITFMQAYLAERGVVGIEREARGNAGFYTDPPMPIAPRMDGSWCSPSVAICSRAGPGSSAAPTWSATLDSSPIFRAPIIVKPSGRSWPNGSRRAPAIKRSPSCKPRAFPPDR